MGGGQVPKAVILKGGKCLNMYFFRGANESWHGTGIKRYEIPT